MTEEELIKKFNDCLSPMRGEEFNVFHWIRLRWDEVDHSGLIKSLLNSKGIHNFEDKFLTLFINELEKVKPESIRNLNFLTKDSSADTEQYAPLTSEKEKKPKNGRIDIYVKSKDQKKAIIIENKLLAKDQKEQLKRYDSWARTTLGDGNYVIVYLTLNGREASKNSSEGVEYIQISYNETIINWLKACIAKIDEEGKDESYMRLRIGIKQYKEYLERRVLKEFELTTTIKENMDLVKSILEKEDLFPDKDTIAQLYAQLYDKVNKSPK